jgi:hypothetical protein
LGIGFARDRGALDREQPVEFEYCRIDLFAWSIHEWCLRCAARALRNGGGGA